jgi:hypothetical protein
MPSSADQLAELVAQLRQMPGLAEQLPGNDGAMVRDATDGKDLHQIANQHRVPEARVWEVLSKAAGMASGREPMQRAETGGLGSDTDPGVTGGYGETGFGSIGNEGPGMPNPDEP